MFLELSNKTHTPQINLKLFLKLFLLLLKLKMLKAILHIFDKYLIKINEQTIRMN